MLPRLVICCRHQSFEIAVPEEQGSAHNWQFSNVNTGPRYGFHTLEILSQNYAGSKQKSCRLMERKCSNKGRSKPDRENISLAAVKRTTVQIAKLTC
jgi:hypothetical protein